MKKFSIAMLCLMNAVFAIAQDNQNKENKQVTQTLFKNPQHIGWYVAPAFAYSKLDERNVYWGGFFGGVIFDHSFSLGLGGYGITNELKYSNISPIQDLYLYGGYGGLKMEYTLNPLKAVHVSFPLVIGGGTLSYNKHSMHDYNSGNNNFQDESFAHDNFFVIEPGITMGVNLIRFIRLDAGVTYRYAPNIELPNTSTGLLNSFNAVISLKFGKF